MVLSLPMVARVGLSYSDVGEAAALAALMVAGSVFACLVSMLWPQRPAAPHATAAEPPGLEYGLRLGAAGRARRRSASCSTSSTSAGPAPPPSS